ncbi:hypothetical protein XO10_05415 [Marinitoga sp. 1135]|uniref:Metalloendopeptidase-like membrane protein n=1 Tax=Marinitoga piezophila (strain DSM 14283 / JCM 11233 / KA3) TaxID=443254 RepID=H2J814_MARPK|nr:MULTISPECIES: M23 family metallopeptidase [Marinitoga]AEX85505.1 metalloendopeptidase-like membrane protein [Marinitoga piezophila KA3]APT75974.1 hypothetical protein LN42_05970 [Marinitoga sp. 1137]NUU95714.1 hypothetical protein [Marinitoga sp. 1135]NUU97646.1 hypothetical protein [Marinitoga sp. 1138]
MKKFLVFTVILLSVLTVFSQRFLPPVKDSYLTSSFGEYRDTGDKPHFHLGIDFSSFSRIGYPVNAAADGYVCKLWVNHKVYGNTIFIYHPDYDLISVYAHLNSFKGLMAEIANSVVSEFGNTFAEIKFPDDEIRVSKGEEIGYSGKSGEAEVPHVHFEIREVKKSGNNEIEIVRDALEFVDYVEMRPRKLQAFEIRSNNRTYKLLDDQVTEVPFTTLPKLEVKVSEKVGDNTTIIPRKISLRVNDELVYEIEFDAIREDEMYSPNAIYGYGSNLFTYWIKLYSSSFITPIKVNRWNEIAFTLKDKNPAELILEDIWGSIKVYKLILVKEM